MTIDGLSIIFGISFISFKYKNTNLSNLAFVFKLDITSPIEVSTKVVSENNLL